MDNYNQGYYQTPQYQPYQQPMQPPMQPTYMPPVQDQTTKVMSVGDYVAFFIISSIPIVNFIMWIVWLCSSNTNKNKKNLILAYIVLFVIGLVIGIIAAVIAAVAGVSLGSLLYSYY